MSWSPEDDRILVDVEQWENQRFRTGRVSAVLSSFFAPIDRFVDMVMPERMLAKLVKPMKSALRSIQDTSKHFVQVDEVLDKGSETGVAVNELKDLRKLPTPYLDQLAKSFFKRNRIVTTLQGAGCSVGGIGMSLVDIPLLFMHNMKMVLQIGTCYGYDPDRKTERDFAYRIFCIVASEREKDRKLVITEINEAITSMVKRGLVGSELRGMAAREISELAITRMIQWIARRKFTTGVPVIGAVIGGGFNYLFTHDMAIYAYMLYRKRFVQEKQVTPV